jgi:hypothetical protein
MVRRIALVLAVMGMVSGAAVAEPASPESAPVVAAPVAAAPPRTRHAVYIELLGKGGLWGLGYSLELHRRIALGVVGSFSVVDGQRIASLSPFMTAYLVGTDRHRWFVDLGPQLVHVSTPSPVPEWMGTSDTGVGAQLATGYELRAHVLVRAFAMAVVGKKGAAPWIGVDVGWTL